jgi:O-6-methylguanine DNA methyltransferase
MFSFAITRHARDAKSCRIEINTPVFGYFPSPLDPATGVHAMKSRRILLINSSTYDSPVGTLFIAATSDTVYYIAFDVPDHEAAMMAHLDQYVKQYELAVDGRPHEKLHRELDQYFSGSRKKFGVKAHLLGTEFQLQVWTALRAIPYGVTVSYKSVAGMIGNPSATRAVGQAVGRNPLPIMIPCHRVIGENGRLVGFGGGIDRKRTLLHIEGSLLM